MQHPFPPIQSAQGSSKKTKLGCENVTRTSLNRREAQTLTSTEKDKPLYLETRQRVILNSRSKTLHFKMEEKSFRIKPLPLNASQ